MATLKIGDRVEIGEDSNGATCGCARKTFIVTWRDLGEIIDIVADTRDGRAAVIAGGSRWAPEALRKRKKPVVKTRKR